MNPRQVPRDPATIVYATSFPGIGALSLRPLRIPDDAPVIHAWVRGERARFWGMQGLDVEGVADAYRAILEPSHVRAYVGLHEGRPAFLVETYRPALDRLRDYYDAGPGDRGMHVLVAPPERRVPGFTWAVFRTVMDFLFADPETDRVVVEPDARNPEIHALNYRAGFVFEKAIELPATPTTPGKTALLCFCSRAAYASARDAIPEAAPPADATPSPLAHLDPAGWAAANRGLVRKILAELSHERLLHPALVARDGDAGEYVLGTDDPTVAYRFRARTLALEHLAIDEASISKTASGKPAPLDAARMIVELGSALGIDRAMLPTYLEEVAGTLYAAAYKRAHQRFTAAELATAGFQDVESSMTAGHPSFIANDGRLGFDVADHRAYAPESASPVRLRWIAAHASRAELHAVPGLDAETLYREELGDATLSRFRAALRRRGGDPAAYVFVPVHPWQWTNELATVFASEIASGAIVDVGESDDAYLPQQSIRTLFNASRPERRYVKTALSILNMGFVRGLSPKYMEGTPAINAWVDALVRGDAFLADRGFEILAEEATVGYRHPLLEHDALGDGPHRKMLAALFRASPFTKIGARQRPMTMAALLHRDRDGASLLAALIASSGLSPEAWLRRYLDAYLAPLLHCFFAHDLVFMPHGENVILVLEDGVPVRALVKDIAEEVAVLDPGADLPERVRRIAVRVPEEVKALSIFTDVFDCFFRYLAEIVVADVGLPERAFWRCVAEVVSRYRDAHPHLAAKLARHDLFAPTFALSCLNRLQLRNNRQMVDLADPATALKLVGTLENPIAPFAGATRSETP